MKIAKQTPTHLKLVHRPWMIWALALFLWIVDCGCIISLPVGSGFLIVLLTIFPLALFSLYPLVVCDLRRDRGILSVKQYGFLGQRMAEYPLHSVSAIELAEGIHSNGNRFYKIRFIAKLQPLYLATAPLEDGDRARYIAQSISHFLDVPLNFVPGRSHPLASFKLRY
jgi:hypothetical protein